MHLSKSPVYSSVEHTGLVRPCISQVCTPRSKAIEGLAQGHTLEDLAGKPNSWLTPGPVLPPFVFSLATGSGG